MKVFPCRGNGNMIDQAMAKMAAKNFVEAASGLPVGIEWEIAKTSLQDGIQFVPVGSLAEGEVVASLEKLAASGTKIGDGTKDTLVREAQGLMGWLGKGLQGIGDFAGGGGEEGEAALGAPIKVGDPGDGDQHQAQAQADKQAASVVQHPFHCDCSMATAPARCRPTTLPIL